MKPTFADRIIQRPPRFVRWGFYAVCVIGFLVAREDPSLRAFFPLVFAIPVLLAAWWEGRWTAYALATISTVALIPSLSMIDLMFRVLALVLLIELVSRTVKLASRVRVLEGLLMMCDFCHRIQNGNEWMPLEQYIEQRSEADFSHGLCLPCAKKHYAMTDEELAGVEEDDGKREISN